MSYGDFGYGFEDNYGYGGGNNWGYGQDNGNWNGPRGGRGQRGGPRGTRKRRGNFDQLQQFDQRSRGGRSRGGWGGQGGWSVQGEDWGYGNDYNQWGNNDYYDDGYGSSRKRSRFYDDDPRGGQFMERGPHSVNFYDDYEDPTFYRSEPRRNRRSEGGRRRENDYGGWGRSDKGRDRRSDARRERRAKPRRKSDAEDAIYEKHKKVTVERNKRDKIGHAVNAVVIAFKEISQKLAQEKYDKEKAAQQPEEIEEEATIEDKKDEETAAAASAQNETENQVDNEKQDEDEKQGDTEKQDDTENNNEEKKENDDDAKSKTNGTEKPPKVVLEPVLLSAVKCGEAAMRILVGDDLQATVVVVSKKKPTRRLLERSIILLEEVLSEDKKLKQEVFFLEFDNDNEALVLKLQSLENFKVLIRFTSLRCSADYEPPEGEEPEDDPLDVLTPANCAAALTQMRRMRYFAKRLDPSPMCLTVVRILLFLRGNREGLAKLPVWLILLLVDIGRNTLMSTDKVDPDKEKDQIRVDTLLIRCIQILSSGVLMPTNPGIKDPCDVDRDAGESLTDQDTESVTSTAGFLLRQIHFGKIRTVLGVETEE